MTLIIKELIIRGIVTKDSSDSMEESFDKEIIMRCLEEMKQSINSKEIEIRLLNIQNLFL